MGTQTNRGYGKISHLKQTQQKEGIELPKPEQPSFFNKETEIKLSDAKKIDKVLEIGDKHVVSTLEPPIRRLEFW